MGLTSTPSSTAAEDFRSTSGDGGSPTAAGLGSGGLPGGSAALLTLAELSADWPELAALRAAASSPSLVRLRCAITSFVSHARVEFAAALIELRQASHWASSVDDASCPAILHGRARHGAALHILRLGPNLRSEWFMSESQARSVLAQVEQLVSLGSGPELCSRPQLPAGPGVQGRFPHVICCFLAALASGWPWSFALEAFRDLDHGQFFENSCIFLSDSVQLLPPLAVWSCSSFSLAGDCVSLSVFIVAGKVVMAQSSSSLRPAPHRPALPSVGQVRKQSRWFPTYIRLACDPCTGLPQLPSARVTDVVERADVWETRLGPLDGTSQAIVRGLFMYPRRSWAYAPSWLRNHPSWEEDEQAKAALGPTIATWLHSGVLEFVPSDCDPPLVVEPVGAVAKSSEPWYRLITDARRSNMELDEWPVRYWTVLEAAAALRTCALLCADDAKDAYHLSAFAGCTGVLISDDGPCLQPDGTVAWSKRYFLGCSPRTCLGTCDKARSGIYLDGFLFRFAAAQFGQKLAGSPLNALFFPIIRHLGRRFPRCGVLLGLLLFLWVDDLLMAQNVVRHDACRGLTAGCEVCKAGAALFAQAQTYWHQLASDLGIRLSPSKRQEIGQRAEYTGIVLDTFVGRLFIPEKKLLKLRACLEALRDADTFSLRELASVRGRVLHYSVCIMYVRPLVPLLFVPDTEHDHLDSRRAMYPQLRNACIMILDIVESFSGVGAPMWPHVPSSLYGRFLKRDLSGLRVVVIIWDSSAYGWGAYIRWWDNFKGKMIVGTFDSTASSDIQVHREAQGGYLALDAASKELDLSEAIVVFRNDAVGALSALRKGSFSSRVLQECATRFNQLSAHLRLAETLFLHAPGKDLVAEGIDDASRRLAQGVSSPASSRLLKNTARSIAERHGWTITVDAFASLCNRVVDRFFSEHAEPDAEAVDALSVTDWNSSVCPACGMEHRETLFVFAPPSLLRRFMAKAEADEVRAIVIVPFSVTAFYWRLLTEVALPVNDAGEFFLVLRNLQQWLVNPELYKGAKLALFAVDFSRQGSRLPNALSPGCGQEARFRGRPRHGCVRDQDDRRRIQLALRQRARPGNHGC